MRRRSNGPRFASNSGNVLISSGRDPYDSGTGTDDGPDGDKYSWAVGLGAGFVLDVAGDFGRTLAPLRVVAVVVIVMAVCIVTM